MGQPLNVGIVGCGAIIQQYLTTFDGLGDTVRLVAVADLDESRAEAVAADRDGVRALTVPELLADSYIDVLATTTQKVREWDPWHRPVTSPAIWTRQWGRGKIFVSTPGHIVDVLQDENVNTIIKRGLLWASR